ncbi:conserved hypothetical protein [Ricinus communis]|uniref:Uncharacterized protein n=1 Tax=Ricinus communis TaxID=3988 RepID=B9SSF7_RICCO|nr:conserved hypothetical protein [Ricinus communis]
MGTLLAPITKKLDTMMARQPRTTRHAQKICKSTNEECRLQQCHIRIGCAPCIHHSCAVERIIYQQGKEDRELDKQGKRTEY